MDLTQAIASYKNITNQPYAEPRIVGNHAEFLSVKAATLLCTEWETEAIISEYKGRWIAVTNKCLVINL